MSENDGRVVSNFIVQALRGHRITVYGDGRQTRSFCYVDDMVKGLQTLMNVDHEESSGPINLGNPEEFSILQLAELICEIIGNRAQIEFLPLPVDDPRQRQPDIGKARRVLDWKPHVRLFDGLMKTIQYFDTGLGAGRIESQAFVAE
jgi:UDP-glucuronate decarboxylase